MEKIDKAMIGTIILAIIVIAAFNACSLISIQVNSGEGRVIKNIDPLDRSLDIAPDINQKGD